MAGSHRAGAAADRSRRANLGRCGAFCSASSPGIVYWFAICYWIQFVLEVHGGMGHWGSWANICAVLCFEGAASGVVQPAGWRAARTRRYAIPAIAALWTGIERTHGTFGFAWLTLGNAGIDMPLPLRVAPFVGVYGISFLFALMSAVVALLILRRGRKTSLLAGHRPRAAAAARVAAARNAG